MIFERMRSLGWVTPDGEDLLFDLTEFSEAEYEVF